MMSTTAEPCCFSPPLPAVHIYLRYLNQCQQPSWKLISQLVTKINVNYYSNKVRILCQKTKIQCNKTNWSEFMWISYFSQGTSGWKSDVKRKWSHFRIIVLAHSKWQPWLCSSRMLKQHNVEANKIKNNIYEIQII